MLAVVPCRGGSKGIPNKNIRLLHGKPLFLHICDTLRQVPEITRIVVSTDSPEIKAIAELHDLRVVDRPARLAGDEVPLAPVVEHVVEKLSWPGEVGLFQPTVPCLSAQTIHEAVAVFRSGDYDSLGFVTRDGHLAWQDNQPLYSGRVNRQDSTRVRELGAFLAACVPAGDDIMVGAKHYLFEVPESEAVDIDTSDDLEAARNRLGRRTIEFRCVVGEQVGTGHFRRCLQLAEELSHHQVVFTPTDWPEWARSEIVRRGWDGHAFAPDVVVFDKLDTTVREVAEVRAAGAYAVCLEDLGPGSDIADLVVNELYEDPRPLVLTGPRWAVLRPEFCGAPTFIVREKAERVLVGFGGTDPAGMNNRVAMALTKDVRVHVLEQGECVAALMRDADLFVCSAGRMAHEAAAVGVPTVTVAVNERESRHSHCPGILRLGLWAHVTDDLLRHTVRELLRSQQQRFEMSATARAAVDGLGGRRLANRIQSLWEGQ